ncbi:hypothetical protein E3N88_00990 [Mikania micrantha]|uniref:Reverse transcriptase Ty1/copia-type domain-containing protein n=1 Tax=Mikania micrantha TaxID=192012 RepID=A0A5N6PZQ3_9ASTR|nr:hypothetical protein E3N88_00990 [Mikania micrantha]
MQTPKTTHYQAVKQILRHVKETTDLGIHYQRNGSNKLRGLSDISCLTDPDDGKGTTWLVFYFDDGPISWCSQKQLTVTLSSCESEFMAATLAACQAIWLRGLLAKVDNKSAISLMKNPALPKIKFAEMREILGVKVLEDAGKLQENQCKDWEGDCWTNFDIK